jgi:5-enolpyruvylshikimate-3-phosphate synthase
MSLPIISINNGACNSWCIALNGVDISQFVSGALIDLRANELPCVTLEISGKLDMHSSFATTLEVIEDTEKS